jgi:hypothetical protein
LLLLTVVFTRNPNFVCHLLRKSSFGTADAVWT